MKSRFFYKLQCILKSDILYNVLIFMFSLVIIYFVVSISYLHMFVGDDFDYGLYFLDEGIFDCLFKTAGREHGGGYLSLFMTRFFSFKLPIMLGLHPADFMREGEAFCQSLFLLMFLFWQVKFVEYTKKFKPLFFIMFIFITAVFVWQIYASEAFWIFTNNNNFWRYILTSLLFSIFIYYLLKVTTNNNYKLNFITMSALFLSAAGACSNQELIMYLTVFLLTLFWIYDLFLLLLNKYQHINIKPFYLNLNKYYWITYIISTAVMFIIRSFPSSQALYSHRTRLGYARIFEIFPNFCAEYFRIYFWEKILLYTAMAILIYTAFKIASLKKDFRKIIFTVFLQGSLYVILFSLIICADSNLSSFWINRNTIIFLFLMISTLNCLILINFILRNTKKRKNVLQTLLSLYILPIFIIINPFQYNIKYTYFQELNNVYVLNYLCYMGEKMLRFYYLKNEKPYLLKLQKDKPFQSCLYEQDENYLVSPMRFRSYYTRTYKDDKILRIGYTFSDDAIERFYKKGGRFYKWEFENLRFSRLKNDDFVLNKTVKEDEEILDFKNHAIPLLE